jgi:hypothetical protein
MIVTVTSDTTTKSRARVLYSEVAVSTLFTRQSCMSFGTSTTLYHRSTSKGSNCWSDGSAPTREAFLRILSDIEAILIRATYHTITSYTSLRDLRMDTAIPTVTSLGRTPMVESCRCPEGHTGLSCEQCAVPFNW